MARKLPRFEPIGLDESRALWKKYRGNHDVERMLLELAHSRDVVHELADYFELVRDSWKEAQLGHFVALEKMRLIFVQENLRQTVLSGLKPPPPKGEPDEPEPALVE